jgi:hypothetical protein
MQIVIGTATMMAWSSSDEGETWNRMTKGVHYPATPAWALSSHPARLGELLVGTDNGIMRWRSADEGWVPLFNEISGTPVWALAHAPWDPDFILAGPDAPLLSIARLTTARLGSGFLHAWRKVAPPYRSRQGAGCFGSWTVDPRYVRTGRPSAAFLRSDCGTH